MDVFVCWMGEKAKNFAFNTAEYLRKNAFKCDMLFEEKSMKAQIKVAVRKNAKFMLIIGEDEINNNVFQLKNIQTQEQIEVSKEELIEKLDELILEEI